MTIFTKPSITDDWQPSEYTRVLNHASGFEYAEALNLPGFWIYQGSEYVRVIQGSEYAWLCLNVWICVNMPKSIRMAFVIHCPIVIPCLLQHLDLFQSFTKLQVIAWRNISVCLLEEIKFDFFNSSRKY